MSEAFQRALREARAAGDPGKLVAAVPYAKFLGMTIDLAEDGVRGTMHYDESLIGNYRLPALHGGTIGALLESTSIFQILWHEDTMTVPKTINVTVQYLRSGKPQDTFSRAHITRHGRRIANVTAWAWQDDEQKPIASATGNFLLK